MQQQGRPEPVEGFHERQAKKEAEWALRSRFGSWGRRWAAANALDDDDPRKRVRMMEARTNMDQAAEEIKQLEAAKAEGK